MIGLKRMMRMVVFCTLGASLSDWKKGGRWDRERYRYERLSQKEMEITFLTYGGSEDLEVLGDARFGLLYNRWNLPKWLYLLLIPFLHFQALRKADIFTTNQISGALPFLWMWPFVRRPLALRMGYLASLQMTRLGRDFRAMFWKWLERLCLRISSGVMVTSQAQRQVLMRALPTCPIAIIPNGIRLDVFKPQKFAAAARSAVYIGNMSPVKNLFALIEAVQGIAGVHLIFYGTGPLRDKLLSFAKSRAVALDLPGIVPGNEIPRRLLEHQVFVLPSTSEGNPKALFEAMACGLAVVASDLPEIREWVKDGEEGLLIEPRPETIREALLRLWGDASLRERLGRNARRRIERDLDLDVLLEKEYGFYEHVSRSIPCRDA